MDKNESNYIIQPAIGEIALEAFNVYKNMMNASKQFSKEICSLCIEDKKNNRTRKHFHGSEFGKCFRQNQYNLITPKKRDIEDLNKNIFLQDGHLHEEVSNFLLGVNYQISHREEEVIITRDIALNRSAYGTPVDQYLVQVVCHTDLIIQTDKTRFLVEFKAVKNWFTKNRYQVGIIPNAYYGQCQIYMEAHNIDYCLLFFKNRESSEIFPPFVIKRNREYINRRFRYLAGILYSTSKMEVVPREYQNKKCDACKFCNYYKECWE